MAESKNDLKYPIDILGVVLPQRFNTLINLGMTATHFFMPEDTDAFCRLIELSINGSNSVLDLGCGDGISTIYALLNGARHVYGVDISEEALDSAARNMQMYTRMKKGTHSGKFDIIKGDMLEILNTRSPPSVSGIDLIVSNPPYIPVGDIASVNTVNGGHDGLRFIRPLLENKLSNKLSWLQGSFSAPAETIKMILLNNWKLKKTLAYAVKFRENAKKQYSYLNLLREKKQAYFYSEDDKDTHWFIKLGFICQKDVPEDSYQIDFQDGILSFLQLFNDYGPYNCVEKIKLLRLQVPIEYGIYSD